MWAIYDTQLHQFVTGTYADQAAATAAVSARFEVRAAGAGWEIYDTTLDLHYTHGPDLTDYETEADATAALVARFEVRDAEAGATEDGHTPAWAVYSVAEHRYLLGRSYASEADATAAATDAGFTADQIEVRALAY